MIELYKRVISYILSLCLVTLLLVYILKFPEFITQSPVLVKEYYYKNALSSFILDVFLFLGYISAAMYLGQMLKIKPTDNSQQLLVLILTTVVISGSFMLYFKLGYNRGSFFSRWFKSVGYKAIIYDVIIVCSVYIIMMILANNFF
jgi:hypothetical protein